MTIHVTNLDTLELVAKGLELRLPVGDSFQAIQWAIGEIRRLREENERKRELLQSVVAFADEAWSKWDADDDMRVGKMLVALAGHCSGYRPDTDAIHAALKP